ncbi:MAG: ATP-binding protein, partial [Actinomycetota bacterium]|nr:ATP-binding protein [Actinomycetota bacterium]
DGGANGDRHVLLAPKLDEGELEQRFVAALDRALGHPPRLRVSAGSVLLEQGRDVGGIYVILDGQVRLIRHREDRERIVHEAAGPIVGLLSLATQRRAFLEVRATTEVRAIPLTLGQLDRALDAEPEIGALLTRLLVNSLASRLRESDELQARVDALAASLATERDQLASALVALEEAQAALIAKARLATLGELAAGIAHELNNPTAALARAAAHVADDATRLIGDDLVRDAMTRALTSEPMPSAAGRAARRALVERFGDRALAERLVAAGVVDVEHAAALAPFDDDRLSRLTAAHQLGTGLRNIGTASARVTDLVESLRAYLRGGDASPFVDDVSVTGTVEDALRLVGHRLASATVTRHYEPVPHITARPGPLQQVWTNLVTNAVDAAGADVHLEVTVDAPEPGRVRVRVGDNGPGVAPEVADHLFEPHFTTKGGQVRFGSGLGLSICRQIVEEHGGTIGLESSGGGTTVTVVLASHPPEHGGGAGAGAGAGRDGGVGDGHGGGAAERSET